MIISIFLKITQTNQKFLIGHDVVKLLKRAIDARDDVNIEVAAILNDTTGCLLSCAWKNPKCRIGLIIGTGTNACYLEDMQKVEYDSNTLFS